MIEFKNVNVVFGEKPERALPLLQRGLGREEINEQTRLVVGVQDANLKVGKGEICVLMGLSGSGKSSLLRCINGLNSVTSGQVLIESDGQAIDFSVASEKVQRHLRMHRISMVFQSFALMPWLTVEENVGFGLELQKVPKAERKKRVARQLELVGLSEWAKRKPGELSGGMQQRVGLARALATESDILLMDEPFSALDPLIRHQLQDELLALQEELQKTIVFVSHDLDEALKIGTNIAIMKDGQIVQHGKPKDIILEPANDYVKDFVASTNPLSVLTVEAIMRDISNIEPTPDGARCLSQRNNYWIRGEQDIDSAEICHYDTRYRIQPWQPGREVADLDRLPTRVPPNTSMRDAMEIRYFTGHSLLIEKDEQLIGAVGDKELYHAMLSKHLSD